MSYLNSVGIQGQGVGFIKDVLANSLGMGIIVYSGLLQKLEGNNPIMNAVITGNAFTLSEDWVQWWLGMGSKIMSGQYVAFEDEALFNALFFYIVQMSQLDQQLASGLQSVSPFPPMITTDLTLGTMVAVTNVVRDYLKGMISPASPLIYLVNPLSAVGLHQ